MISRRNFISILMMMGVLLFMFQITEVVKERQANFEFNTYYHNERLSGANAWEPEAQGKYEDGDFVMFLGKVDAGPGPVVESWCSNTKRNLEVIGSLRDCELSPDCLPEEILVDTGIIDIRDGMDLFDEIAGYGIPLVFCNLPRAVSLMGEDDLLELLGIKEIRSVQVKADGVHLFGDFLLGGERFYIADKEDEEQAKLQNLELNVPWYLTGGGTKTYMVATLNERLEDVEEKNEIAPALIWRNNYKDGQVYVVNGDYLGDMGGIGILNAISYEASDYDLYPVVNAQNVTVLNFPTFAEENEDKMMELYSRDTEGVLRDVCWPMIAALAKRREYKLTCLFDAQFDYADENEPSNELLPFYLQQMKESESEAGISLDRREETDFGQKLFMDGRFFDYKGLSYEYGVVYVDNDDFAMLPKAFYSHPFWNEITTLTGAYQKYDPIVSYFDEDLTRQNVTADATFHGFAEDLTELSIETALGYSNVVLDMYPVIWPQTKDDQWEKVSESVVSNLDTYWKPFANFEKTTLSESDGRVRSFLNLDYETSREDQTISLDISGTSKCYFLLRTHDEKIAGIRGGEYTEIEKNAYLIEVLQPHIEIQVEGDRNGVQFTPE